MPPPSALGSPSPAAYQQQVPGMPVGQAGWPLDQQAAAAQAAYQQAVAAPQAAGPAAPAPAPAQQAAAVVVVAPPLAPPASAAGAPQQQPVVSTAGQPPGTFNSGAIMLGAIAVQAAGSILRAGVDPASLAAPGAARDPPRGAGVVAAPAGGLPPMVYASVGLPAAAPVYTYQIPGPGGGASQQQGGGGATGTSGIALQISTPVSVVNPINVSTPVSVGAHSAVCWSAAGWALCGRKLGRSLQIAFRHAC